MAPADRTGSANRRAPDGCWQRAAGHRCSPSVAAGSTATISAAGSAARQQRSGRRHRAGRSCCWTIASPATANRGESGGRGRAGSRRLRSASGRLGLLRPAAAISKGLSHEARELAHREYRAAVAVGRAGRADRRLRAKLLVDVGRRVSRPRARRGAASRWPPAASLVDSHLVGRARLCRSGHRPGRRGPAARPLPSEGAGRAWPGRCALLRPASRARRDDADRLRLLRHGRLVRLRALRPEHEDRPSECYSRRARAAGRDGRRAGLLLPPPDRARHRAPSASSGRNSHHFGLASSNAPSSGSRSTAMPATCRIERDVAAVVSQWEGLAATPSIRDRTIRWY